MDQTTNSVLEKIGEIVSSSETTSNWFAAMPGYSYQWARYTDWIKPYLLNIITGKSYQYKSSMNKLIKQSALKALRQFEPYFEVLAKIDGQPIPDKIEDKDYASAIDGIANPAAATGSIELLPKKMECDKGHAFTLHHEPVPKPEMACTGEYVNCKGCSNMIIIKDGFWMCDFLCDYRVCSKCAPAR